MRRERAEAGDLGRLSLGLRRETPIDTVRKGSISGLIFLALSSATPAWAFHEGGEGFCLGCHDLSKSRGATDIRATLLGSDASSTCLRCHATSTESYAPGGSFAWLARSFAWQASGVRHTSAGDAHGHNVVAADYAMQPDSRLDAAPGGRFPARELACTSCHDPHGQLPRAAKVKLERPMVSPSSADLEVERVFRARHPKEASGTRTYRMLAGVGYVAGVGQMFTSSAPIAAADAGDWSETDTDHPIYQSGMSEWCTNCHSAYLHGGRSHVSGAAIGATMAGAYRDFAARIKTTGGQSGYFALVPFELGKVDADPRARLDGPSAAARVMCLTCHRGHASAFSSIGRWDFETTFMAESHPKAEDSGARATDARDAYYGRDLASSLGRYERQLCSACHGFR